MGEGTRTDQESKSGHNETSLMTIELPPAYRAYVAAKGLFEGLVAYSTRWRTRFQADGGQCSTAMADTVPR